MFNILEIFQNSLITTNRMFPFYLSRPIYTIVSDNIGRLRENKLKPISIHYFQSNAESFRTVLFIHPNVICPSYQQLDIAEGKLIHVKLIRAQQMVYANILCTLQFLRAYALVQAYPPPCLSLFVFSICFKCNIFFTIEMEIPQATMYQMKRDNYFT